MLPHLTPRQIAFRGGNPPDRISSDAAGLGAPVSYSFLAKGLPDKPILTTRRAEDQLWRRDQVTSNILIPKYLLGWPPCTLVIFRGNGKAWASLTEGVAMNKLALVLIYSLASANSDPSVRFPDTGRRKNAGDKSDLLSE